MLASDHVHLLVSQATVSAERSLQAAERACDAAVAAADLAQAAAPVLIKDEDEEAEEEEQPEQQPEEQLTEEERLLLEATGCVQLDFDDDDVNEPAASSAAPPPPRQRGAKMRAGVHEQATRIVDMIAQQDPTTFKLSTAWQVTIYR